MNFENVVANMKSGFVLRFNAEKQIGVICGDDLQRYFLHAERIVRGALQPKPNDRCIFTVSDRPVRWGHLPAANQIVILEDAGFQALAEQNETGKTAEVK
jgi:hypothetical protein